MLKKTVPNYRYGHYVLLGLTEDFVFVYDLKTETISEYHVINIHRQLDCVHRWAMVGS